MSDGWPVKWVSIEDLKKEYPMKRSEQIEAAAYQACGEGADYFIMGAEWADANPVPDLMFDDYAEQVMKLEAKLAIAVEALEKVCKRNDIKEAVLDYYGDCAMALEKIK